MRRKTNKQTDESIIILSITSTKHRFKLKEVILQCIRIYCTKMNKKHDMPEFMKSINILMETKSDFLHLNMPAKKLSRTNHCTKSHLNPINT